MSKSLKKNSLTIHTLENYRIYIAFHSDRLVSTPLLSPPLFAGLVSRVPSRFSGYGISLICSSGFAIRDFTAKSGRVSGLTVCEGGGVPGRDNGIARNLGSGLRD